MGEQLAGERGGSEIVVRLTMPKRLIRFFRGHLRLAAAGNHIIRSKKDEETKIKCHTTMEDPRRFNII